MDSISRFSAGGVELGPLATLSLQHTHPGVTPEAPSNEERARAFRNTQPVALANNFEWPFRRIVGGQQAVARLMATDAAGPESTPTVRSLATARAVRLRRRTLPA